MEHMNCMKRYAPFECMWLLRSTPHKCHLRLRQLIDKTVTRLIRINNQQILETNITNRLLTDWFSYLLLFRTSLMATRIRHQWTQALCIPLGQLIKRSHHHILSPILHCRKLPPGPHSVCASPRLDVAGLLGCQIPTVHSTAPTCTTKLARNCG